MEIVEGQVQGGVKDDDVFAIPTLEDENVGECSY